MIIPLVFICFILLRSDLFAHVDVTAQEAKNLIDSDPGLIIVDVREEDEFCDENGHIPGAFNYPWNSGVLTERYEELPRDADILLVCRSGYRSNLAAEFLDDEGFSAVYDMLGGMAAWEWETVGCSDDDCPLEVVLKGEEEKLNIARSFRDEVLMDDQSGCFLTFLYYRHRAEASAMLSRYPALRKKAQLLFEALQPAIKSRLIHSSAKIDQKTVGDLEAFLDQMEVKGTNHLQVSIMLLEKALQNVELFNGLKIFLPKSGLR